MKRILILMLLFGAVLGCSKQKKVESFKPVPMFPTYKGLLMCGYQGWFRAEGDDAKRGWGSYGVGEKFEPEHPAIDNWPDVSGYEKTYETNFLYPDGSKARVFSSLDESTVDLHFKWMKEYGIDGVFMQRFYFTIKDDSRKKEQDFILFNAFKASQKYDRAIAVMYDLSGLKPGEDDCQRVIEDWKHLVDDLKVKNFGKKQTYLYHRSKPLVTIWGVGFPDRSYDIKKIKLAELIDFLKNDPVYGGCSVMLGVPTYFRELDKDCSPEPYLHELIKSVDIVLPWMVQRFTPLVHKPLEHIRDHIKADIKWTKERGVDYVPIAYPGFSWRNMALTKPKLARYTTYGAIPRMKGQFFWDQMATMVEAGAEMLYVAMFDEVNEGTAIFKVSDTPPNSDKYHFIDNDGMPSDHYLFLTGQGARMLRKEIPASYDMPNRSGK
jgi:hypothetical protein